MNHSIKPILPHNPYKRSPVKKREDLAGRARELKSIRYYLGLTAAGQSPHLALIGQRGVGKTSLLNGAESIAKDLKLLPIRLDMNEQKANSQWLFWHDLYLTMALTMAKAGSWGGQHGVIYAELLRMICSRQPGNLDRAVMQIPYVFSCHQGNIENFECPDALVVNDFETCLVELRSKGLAGFALLIDEADCLGHNVPLLQMFRNIFQVVESCSLLLAGTEAVFPALSEVFSPIPRQFHRVDVKPFARWPDTRELVLHPIPKEIFETVAPEPEVILSLHELCGGAPDEVQLYCHHMYRSVEDGSTTRMSLAPQVFREVLREYRSNSPANVDAVLNAIERLSDKLLFASKWLSRTNVTLEENIQIVILSRELELNKPLSADEKAGVVTELTTGYARLFEAGIIEINNCIRLAGAPLSAGFWKSFVEVERGKRWTWENGSFAEILRGTLIRAIGVACGSRGQTYSISGKDAVSALRLLREGKTPPGFDEGMTEMILCALTARERKFDFVADVVFQIESPAGKHTDQCRFFEKTDCQLRMVDFEEWLAAHRSLLAGNSISITITGFDRWELPSPVELQRLGRISGYRIPDVLGPSETEQAVKKFEEGDIQGCMETFSRMLGDKDAAFIRNNLAFCQFLTGNVAEGLENAAKALMDEYEPLYELNKGIGEFLTGNVDAAKKSLRNALDQLGTPGTKLEPSAAYVLVIGSSLDKVSSYAGIPVDAAILINLWRMAALTLEELEAGLLKLNSEMAKTWLGNFVVSE